MTISPNVFLLSALVGASSVVGFAYVRLWRSAGEKTAHHRWMALFSLCAGVVCALRMVQMTLNDPLLAGVIGRVYGGLILLMPLVWLAVQRSMGDRPIVDRTFNICGVVSLLCSVGVVVPNIFLSTEPMMRNLIGGFTFYGLTPTRWGWVLPVAMNGVAIAMVYDGTRHPAERAFERRILVGSTFTAIIIMQTSLLSAIVSTWFPPLGSLALPLLVLPCGYLLMRRIEGLRLVLEQEVDSRTTALTRTNTDLREAVKSAESAREAQSRFLANVSHELRTPLTGVLGVLEVVDDLQLEEQAASLVHVARGSGHQLLTLINQLLDLARLDAEMVELESKPVRLAALCDHLVRTHQASASNKRLTLDHHVDASCPEVVLADPVRLRQILDNLLSNAVKFTSAGSVRLTVAPNDEQELVWAVTDTGPGLDPNDKERLFERFAQADDSTTRRFGGSGLGLSLSRELARLMGGDLTARNHEGAGAVFELRLALEETTLDEPGVTPSRKRTNRRRFRGRCLLVDDDPTNRLIITRILEVYGLQVDISENGQKALQHLQTHAPPDLVFMDCYMPVLDGFQTTERIRRRNDGLAEIPIIALTASAGVADRAASRRAGMNEHLSKPLVLEDLEGVLDRFLLEVTEPTPVNYETSETS